MESAKLGALPAHVPTCLAPFLLTCSRANVSCVLMCSCANLSYVLSCSRANVSCVFTRSRANLPCVLTLQFSLRADVPTCIVCLRTYVLWLQTTKISFQWHVFLRLEIKLYMKSARGAGISLEISYLRIRLYIPEFFLTRRKSLTGAMTNFLK